jgi:hypothetical protein
MEIICGARKSFLEFSLRLTIHPELVDLQEEIQMGTFTIVNVFQQETGRIICAKKYQQSPPTPPI